MIVSKKDGWGKRKHHGDPTTAGIGPKGLFVSFDYKNAPFSKRNNIAKLLYCPELIENLLLCCQTEKLKQDIFMCVILPYLETVNQSLYTTHENQKIRILKLQERKHLISSEYPFSGGRMYYWVHFQPWWPSRLIAMIALRLHKWISPLISL